MIVENEFEGIRNEAVVT